MCAPRTSSWVRPDPSPATTGAPAGASGLLQPKVFGLARFFVRWALRITAALVLLAIGIYFFRDELVRQGLSRRIRAVTGLHTELAEAVFRPGEGLLTLRDLRIHNSPAFGGGPLLLAPGLHLALDTDSLRHGQLRFRELHLSVAHLAIVRDSQGRTNLQEILDTAQRQASPLDAVVFGGAGFEFVGIDRLHLTLGTLHVVDMNQPGIRRSFPIGLTNEIVENVRTSSDLGPLIMRLIAREISATLSRSLTNRGPAAP